MTAMPVSNARPLRVLFVALKYDYGIPERGPSYEYTNFFDTLRRMRGVEATLFAFDERMRQRGRKRMNAELVDTVSAQKPDLCFFFLFTDEIEQQTIEQLSAHSDTVTINWFADDHWRFDVFSRYWAKSFHWVITTDKHAVERYHRMGLQNVILSQWGCNHFLYKPIRVSPQYDVTFVGQAHSHRREIVQRLHRIGLNVQCWGRGWPNGRLSQQEMIALYSKSKINLNFSESSAAFNFRQLAKVFLNRRADGSIHVRTPKEMLAHARTLTRKTRMQIKGRNFEVPAAGGFLLTQHADGIDEFFVPDKEVVTFSTEDELQEKVSYYLAHDAEREAIRRAGHERALREHTLERRFSEIFEKVLRQSRIQWIR